MHHVTPQLYRNYASINVGIKFPTKIIKHVKLQLSTIKKYVGLSNKNNVSKLFTTTF